MDVIVSGICQNVMLYNKKDINKKILHYKGIEVSNSLKERIVAAIQHLPERERGLVEAKFFQDKKLKDIAIEFNISQSRISRIIQNALDKVRRELQKQE